MGFGFDLVTRPVRLEEKSDHYRVTIETNQSATLSRMVVQMRARARAILATGVIEAAGNTSRDIGRSIMEMDASEIQRLTEVIVPLEEKGGNVVVKVNK